MTEEQKSDVPGKIIMCGGLFGAMCIFSSNSLITLIGLIGSLLTIISFLTKVYKELNFLAISCSLNFSFVKYRSECRIGRNSDSDAIMFNRLLQFTFFYCIAIIVYTIFAYWPNGKLAIMFYCFSGIMVLISLWRSVPENVCLPMEYRATGIICWFLYAVGVQAGRVVLLIDFVCIFVWFASIQYYLTKYLTSSRKLKISRNGIKVFLVNGECLELRPGFFYFNVEEAGVYTLLYEDLNSQMVQSVEEEEILEIEGIENMEDFLEITKRQGDCPRKAVSFLEREEKAMEAVMHMQVTKKLFDLMIEVKEKHLAVVEEEYHCSRQELCDILWEEFNIPGMETRIANTALDFLIVSCEKKEDLEDTLRKEVKRNVLGAGIYYTNVAPGSITICTNLITLP